MVDENFARRLAQDLVKIDNSDPGAYEGGIEHFIKRLIEKQLAQLDSPALDAVQIKEFEVLPRAPQPYGHRAGTERRATARLYLPYGYRYAGRWLGRGHTAARGDRAGRQALWPRRLRHEGLSSVPPMT